MVTAWHEIQLVLVHNLPHRSAREMTFHSRFCFFYALCSFLQIYTRYGKCYTFNSGSDGNPLLTTLKGGTGNGLEIMLDIQQDEYLPVWGETGQFSIYLSLTLPVYNKPPDFTGLIIHFASKSCCTTQKWCTVMFKSILLYWYISPGLQLTSGPINFTVSTLWWITPPLTVCNKSLVVNLFNFFPAH